MLCDVSARFTLWLVFRLYVVVVVVVSIPGKFFMDGCRFCLAYSS